MDIAIIDDNDLKYPTDSFFYKTAVTEIFALNLNPNEFKLLMFIFHKTVGFKKKWDFIAKFLFEDELSMSRRPTEVALKALETNNFISVYRNPSARKKNSTAKYNAYSISDDFMEVVLCSYEENLNKYNDS